MPGAYVRVEHVNRVASGAMECKLLGTCSRVSLFSQKILTCWFGFDVGASGRVPEEDSDCCCKIHHCLIAVKLSSS